MDKTLDIDQERLIADFMTLVSIGSHSREEANVAAYIKGAVEELGYVVAEDHAGDIVGGNTGNLIVRVPGNPNWPTILLMAHMDTVAPGHGVRPIRHADRITSDGKTVLGADDKAGVAGLLHLLTVLHSTKEEHPPLEVVFTICEEVGLLGAKALDRSSLQASYGFVFDSGGPLGSIVTHGPAQAKMKALVHGKAAHAGMAPEKGVSAIEVTSQAIAKMHLGRIDDHTTANIGQIKGGFATNIVCDLVELYAEARSLNDDRLRIQQEHMTQVLQATAKQHGVFAEVDWTASYPSFALPQDSFLRIIATNAMNRMDVTPTFVHSGGGSDANVINSKGIPVINLAVAYQQIHTLEEWISLDNLTGAAQMILEIVRATSDYERHV